MRTALVTGATSGIGLEVARRLLEDGFFVIGTGRDKAKCEAALAQLKSNNAIFLQCDNSGLRQVKELARKVEKILGEKGLGLDVLINNAGCYTSKRMITEDGLEMQIAVNYVSAYLLTRLLLPLLLKSPSAKVISVSSKSHYLTRFSASYLKIPSPYFGLLAYKRSKLALVMMTHELNRRFGGGNFTALAADPGLVNTEIGLKRAGVLSRLVWSIRKNFGTGADRPAKHIARLASADISVKKYYYFYEGKEKRPSRASLDDEKCLKLWKLTEQACREYLA